MAVCNALFHIEFYIYCQNRVVVECLNLSWFLQLLEPGRYIWLLKALYGLLMLLPQVYPKICAVFFCPLLFVSERGAPMHWNRLSFDFRDKWQRIVSAKMKLKFVPLLFLFSFKSFILLFKGLFNGISCFRNLKALFGSWKEQGKWK